MSSGNGARLAIAYNIRDKLKWETCKSYMRYSSPHIKAYYQDALSHIMQEHGIRRGTNPSHIVGPRADFLEVVQHTYRFLIDPDHNRPHYRYDRYREVLEHLRLLGVGIHRQSHIDIGCGAGLFSWAFLDWARDTGLDYGKVDLFGLDHSPQMIRLAQTVRAKLLRDFADYPPLHYTENHDILLRELSAYHAEDTEYTVTFGHVLVQAGTPENIRGFAHLIEGILMLQHFQLGCNLIAVDARREFLSFNSRWRQVIETLDGLGITAYEVPVPRTPINDDWGARVASLTVR